MNETDLDFDITEQVGIQRDKDMLPWLKHGISPTGEPVEVQGKLKFLRVETKNERSSGKTVHQFIFEVEEMGPGGQSEVGSVVCIRYDRSDLHRSRVNLLFCCLSGHDVKSWEKIPLELRKLFCKQLRQTNPATNQSELAFLDRRIKVRVVPRAGQKKHEGKWFSDYYPSPLAPAVDLMSLPGAAAVRQPAPVNFISPPAVAILTPVAPMSVPPPSLLPVAPVAPPVTPPAPPVPGQLIQFPGLPQAVVIPGIPPMYTGEIHNTKTRLRYYLANGVPTHVASVELTEMVQSGQQWQAFQPGVHPPVTTLN